MFNGASRQMPLMALISSPEQQYKPASSKASSQPAAYCKSQSGTAVNDHP